MRYFYFFFLLICFSSFAQTTEENKKENPIKVKGGLWVYAYKPIPFGDNVIAKAHNAKNIGLGLEVQIIEIYNIGLAGGFQFYKFDVTNKALAGNGEETNNANYFVKANYDLNFSEVISFSPFLGIGTAEYRLKNNSKKLGKQQGTTLYLGANANFKIDKVFSGFIGAEYQFSKLGTTTNSEYDAFVNNLQQLNIKIGLVLK
jgi:hypothetical protein